MILYQRSIECASKSLEEYGFLNDYLYFPYKVIASVCDLSYPGISNHPDYHDNPLKRGALAYDIVFRKKQVPRSWSPGLECFYMNMLIA